MINNETIIYELCNKYQWFTCGGVRQYEKALTMAKGGVPITELARVIWICSDEVALFRHPDRNQHVRLYREQK